MKKIIIDCESQEVTEREMTKAELTQYEKDQKLGEIAKAEAEAKEAERQAILDRIGLTADELKTILG